MLENASTRFSFLLATLQAERPMLFALLILAASIAFQSSIRADEPIKLALASTSTGTSTVFTNTFKLSERTSGTDTNSLKFSFNAGKTNLLANDSPGVTDNLKPTPTVIVIEKPKAPGLFSNQDSVGCFGFAGIEAGYGQAYDCDSIVLRGRNGTAWEETRYVFVKKVLKF